MRHRDTTKTLGRTAAPRQAMMKQLATSLVLHESINTTLAKAKVLRPYIERLVTTARPNTIHARRELMKILQTEGSVRKMLEVIGPRYAARPGGYTRIRKVGRRQGDGAPMAEISFV